jgi:hypothetical protein
MVSSTYAPSRDGIKVSYLDLLTKAWMFYSAEQNQGRIEDVTIETVIANINELIAMNKRYYPFHRTTEAELLCYEVNILGMVHTEFDIDNDEYMRISHVMQEFV